MDRRTSEAAMGGMGSAGHDSELGMETGCAREARLTRTDSDLILKNWRNDARKRELRAVVGPNRFSPTIVSAILVRTREYVCVPEGID